MTLTDGQGRKHDYLRISITDRCNLRCVYCMGEEGIEQLKHEDILSYEDILKVVRAGAELGISKIRITGGEPLVRRGVVDLIRNIAATPGISDLAMTTNGILLDKYAGELKKAGLKRVNISLDSMQPEKYNNITRCGKLDQALRGIEAALDNKLNPVKLNVVLMKGVNDDEIIDFLELTRKKTLHVRFIEYMPIGDHDCGYRDHYLPLTYIEEVAIKAGFPLTPVPLPGGAGPAESYTIAGGQGTIGLIHPISKHFCDTCNRLRLTAEGNLKACLYWQDETPVQPVINDNEALKDLIQEVLKSKPVEHQMGCDGKCGSVNPGSMRSMSKTGG
ncbi:MAG: GTP 3',8-cyclase MoaA [Firmicutes bacterium]|nr:GTP 3',8-cyclase MoaA [Bacillota bacterium]